MSSKLSSLTVLGKARKVRDVIKHHGGIRGAVLQLLRTDELKIGNLVGVDQFGNKYYHNPDLMISRSRWVDYAPQFGYDYDSSQIPPEWHRWLHYITDEVPTEKPLKKPEWICEYRENLTGTPDQYVPYSTTRPKIEAWTPPKK